LELQGAPVWGLSSEERDMIVDARAKVKECWMLDNEVN
jgi:hypothetical protein